MQGVSPRGDAEEEGEDVNLDETTTERWCTCCGRWAFLCKCKQPVLNYEPASLMRAEEGELDGGWDLGGEEPLASAAGGREAG